MGINFSSKVNGNCLNPFLELRDGNQLLAVDKRYAHYDKGSLGSIVSALQKTDKIWVQSKESLEQVQSTLKLVNRCVYVHNNSGLKTFLKILLLPWLFATIFNCDFFKKFDFINEKIAVAVKFTADSLPSRPSEQEFFDHTMDLLEKGNVISQLEFNNYPFTQANFDKLTKALSQNKSLRSLKMERTDLNNSQLFHLYTSIKGHPTIEELSFEGTNLHGGNSVYIAYLLQRNHVIRHLNLSETSLESTDIGPIVGVLETDNKSLQSLNLYWNYLHSAGTELVANMLKHNKTLRYLNLGGNDIKVKAKGILSCSYDLVGVNALAAAVKSHPSLEALDVRRNSLEEEGSLPLIETLKTNQRIKFFDISWNRLSGNRVAQALLEAFSNNSSLRHFSAYWNNLSLSDLTEIARGLIDNHSITHVDLAANNVMVSGRRELANVFNHNQFPRKIRYSSSAPFVGLGVALFALPYAVAAPFTVLPYLAGLDFAGAMDNSNYREHL